MGNEKTLGKVQYTVQWNRKKSDGNESAIITYVTDDYADAVTVLQRNLELGAYRGSISANRMSVHHD